MPQNVSENATDWMGSPVCLAALLEWILRICDYVTSPSLPQKSSLFLNYMPPKDSVPDIVVPLEPVILSSIRSSASVESGSNEVIIKPDLHF